MPQFRFLARSGALGSFCLAAMIAASVSLPVEPAEAQPHSYYDGGFFGGWFQRPYQARPPRYRERMPERRPSRRLPADDDDAITEATRELKGETARKSTGPVYGVVSLADQRISVYDANGLLAQSIVSTGVAGHATPPGIFSILEKNRYHRSNIYSGAPMPFMQRLTWTGVALHEGVVTGRPASHGCIRLPGAFAKRLFGLTDMGQRFIVATEDVKPVEVSHARLPAPSLQPPPASADGKVAAAKAGKPVETVAMDLSGADAAPGLLNPVEFAQALKAASVANARAAVEAKKAAILLASSKSEGVRQGARAVAAAEESVRRASLDVEATNTALEKAVGEDAVKIATEREEAAEASLVEAEAKLAEASALKADKDREFAAAQDAVRDANVQTTAAIASSKDALTRMEPVSMFISRKTKRLYVRQAKEPLFDMPVTIRDPERPLGTHLFIATRPGSDKASLRWIGLTPPAAGEVKRPRHSSRKGHKIEHDEDAAAPKPFPESAATVLDRIEIPQAALERLSTRIWTGATLIVSDVGMSGEGRFAMDFMILNHTPVRDN